MPLEVSNLFRVPVVSRGQEQIHALVTAPGVRIEQIVSHGQASPEGVWYDQANPEWVALLKGTAMLLVESGGLIELSSGDCLLIPAHVRHRVERVSEDAVWLAVHFAEDH